MGLYNTHIYSKPSDPHLCQRNFMSGPDPVFRCRDIRIDDQFPQVSSSHQNLRLVIGQSDSVTSKESGRIRQCSSIRQQLRETHHRSNIQTQYTKSDTDIINVFLLGFYLVTVVLSWQSPVIWTGEDRQTVDVRRV